MTEDRNLLVILGLKRIYEMRANQKLRLNSVTYFVLSVLIRWVYNLVIFLHRGFTVTERGILHLLLAAVSVLFAWFALQLFRKSTPSGSNLGCFYLILLVLNFIGGLGAVFFAMVKFFSEEGGAETLWLA